MKSLSVLFMVVVVCVICLMKQTAANESSLDSNEFANCNEETLNRVKTLHNSVEYSKRMLEELSHEQVAQEEEAQDEHEYDVEYLKDIIAYKSGHIEYIKKNCPIDSANNPLNKDPIPLFVRINQQDKMYKEQLREAQSENNQQKIERAQADLQSWQEQAKQLKELRQQWREKAQSGDISFKPEIQL